MCIIVVTVSTLYDCTGFTLSRLCVSYCIIQSMCLINFVNWVSMLISDSADFLQ